MAFRKKWSPILALDPDILVIQECEKESKFPEDQIIPEYNQFLWFGENENKGIGIISFNNYHLELSPHYNDQFRYIIPIHVTGDAVFTLFAVWAMPDKKISNRYVGQIWNALNFYKADLIKGSVWLGDFNSNAIWDKSRKNGNHSDVVDFLGEYGIRSIYHELTQEENGKESQPTIYLLKQVHKPFHLDYCFVPHEMIGPSTTVTVGSQEKWIRLSDHMPLIIDGLGEF